jgi:hypothetical protein
VGEVLFVCLIGCPFTKAVTCIGCTVDSTAGKATGKQSEYAIACEGSVVETEEGLTCFLWVLLHKRQYVIDWAGGVSCRGNEYIDALTVVVGFTAWKMNRKVILCCGACNTLAGDLLGA